jgi:hypothetical protein
VAHLDASSGVTARRKSARWLIQRLPRCLEGIARRLLDQDANQRRWWLLWLEVVIEAQRDPSRAFPLSGLEARSRSSIADILKEQLPGIDEDLTLATALQAIWRGWLLGAAADQQSDAEGLARAMEWLIAGAAAGSKDQASPSRSSSRRPSTRGKHD